MFDIDFNPATGVFGRRVLYASPPAELNAQTIGAILNDVLPLHFINKREIEYLYKFAKGHQPIQQREKTIRPEIKNITTENRAREVLDFKKGYELSNTPQLVNIGADDKTAYIELLNTFDRLDGAPAKILNTSEWYYKSGTGYRICLPKRNATIDDAPYFTDVLDPRETFVVYSREIGHEELFAGSFVKQKDLETGAEKYKCGVYTATRYFEWTVDSESADFTETAPEEKANGIGMIPIVEYMASDDRMGYVDLCHDLFNAINTLNSNRLDAVEQFVQAYLVFINCQLPEDPTTRQKIVPRAGDAIEVGNNSANADVKYLVAQLDQQQTQIMKDDLLKAIYDICGIPSKQERSSGSDTGRAAEIRTGRPTAEDRALATEKLYEASDMKLTAIKLRICRDTQNVDIGNLTLRDIKVKFNRTKTENMQSKAQTLATLLDKGVDPETSYATIGLFSDPTATWLKSKQWQDEDAAWIETKLKLARKIGGEEPPPMPDEIIEVARE